MKINTAYRWLLGAFIALFFALQSLSLAHASSYGDAPHEHDGIACSVTVMADDHIIITPPPHTTQPNLSETVKTVYPDFTSVSYLKPQGRAPPPRAPPFSI